MANLYFNAAVDNDWAELGNWWTNEACTAAAASLPTSSDSVVTLGVVGVNSGDAIEIASLTINGDFAVGTGGGDSVAVQGDVTINSGVVSGSIALLAGTAVFNGGYLDYSGGINGNAEFNNSSYNLGFISGDATFNDYATADETCYGNVTANDYAYIFYSTNSTPASATFNDYSTHGNGFVSHNNTMNDNSFVNNQGYANGDSFTFNDNSYGGVNSFVVLYVNGNPIVMTTGIIAYSLTFGFVRRSGINGSSILGVM